MAIRLFKDDTGASAAEYALVLALVGTGIILGAIFLGNAISDRIYATGNCISSASAC